MIGILSLVDYQLEVGKGKQPVVRNLEVDVWSVSPSTQQNVGVLWVACMYIVERELGFWRKHGNESYTNK